MNAERGNEWVRFCLLICTKLSPQSYLGAPFYHGGTGGPFPGFAATRGKLSCFGVS